jgi:hypothetical protein
MDFLKTVTGKVISGLVALGVVVCGVSWYFTAPATKQMLLAGTGKIFAWLGIVLVVPWLAFAVIGWVAKFERNSAGAALVAVLTIGEMVFLAWLFSWTLGSATAWSFFVLGGLIAALYNLFTCDWIAEKVG